MGKFDLVVRSLLVQVVTVGVVGGSDLVKISEQLGKSGMYLCTWISKQPRFSFDSLQFFSLSFLDVLKDAFSRFANTWSIDFSVYAWSVYACVQLIYLLSCHMQLTHQHSVIADLVD